MDKNVLHPKQSQWDLSPLFSSDDDPAIEIERKKLNDASYKFINKWKDRSDYLENPLILADALAEYEFWVTNYGVGGKESYYLGLRQSQDQNDSNLKAKSNKLTEVATKIANDIAFFNHRISKIPEKDQQRFLDAPELSKYRHRLERQFATAKYLLSEAEEKIINLKSPSSYGNWVKMTSAFLSKEEREVLLEDGTTKKAPFSEIASLVKSKDKKVRDVAAKGFYSIVSKLAPIAEEEMNSILLDKKVDDELRGISRPDMPMHISDDIETEVVDCMLDSVKKRFKQSHRFYKLKAQLLGLKKLKYSERNVPYGEIRMKYSFPEAAYLVDKVFNKLDPEFSKIFRSFLDEGRIDVYPKVGKIGGAFCASDLQTTPVYILLNHMDNLEGVTTLAHEMGHGLNDTYIHRTQNALNSDSPLSTAEVASTFFEDFVFEELLQNADDETRLAILMEKLSDQISTIHRQVGCYVFEQRLHQAFRDRGYLAAKDINELFVQSMKDYLGSGVKFEKGSEFAWVHWSHIRSYFYVYSYASGLLISKAMQSKVRENPKFIEKVKEFLSAGLNKSPRNIFLDMGIDIEDPKFWNAGLDEVDRLLDTTESLAKKLGKLL